MSNHFLSVQFLAAWLGHAFVAASLLMLMTLALMTLLGQPASRQRLGEVGLTLALLTMPLCLFGPRLWSIDWSSRHQPLELPMPLDLGEWADAEAEVAEPGPWAEPVAVAKVAATSSGATWWDWFEFGLQATLALYGAGVIFFLGRWLIGLVGLWRLTRNAIPAEPEIVDEVRRHWPGRALPRILQSPRLKTPISFGVVKPTIILPGEMAASPAEREWMLTHELTHLERRDAWSMQLLLLAQAIFYPMPWCGWLRRQVRLCQEYVADAAAARVPVAREQSVEDYAEFLVRLAASRSIAPHGNAPHGVSSLVSGVTSSDLSRRVTMLLEQHPRFEKRGSSWTLLSAGFALAAVAVLSSGVRAQDRIEIKPNVQVIFEPKAAIAVPAGQAVQVQQVQEQDVLFLRAELGEAIGQALLGAGGNPKAVAALERILKQLDGPADQLDLKELRQDLRKALADLKQIRVQPIQGIPIQGIPAIPAQVVPFVPPVPPLPPMAPLPPLPPAAGFKLQIVTPDGQVIPENVQALIQKMLQDGKVDAVTLAKEIDKARALAKKAEEEAKKFQIEIEAAPFALQGKLFAARPGGFLFKMAGVRSRLGLVVDPVNDVLAEQLDLPKQRGVVVSVVVPDSPAAKAGIKVNDILLKVNDQDLTNEPEAFAKLIVGLPADKEFSLVLRRRGKEETVSGLKIAAPAFTAATPGLFQRDSLSITTQRANDSFTTRCQEGGTLIIVTGSLKDNQVQVSRISIEEAGKADSYDSIDRVPEKYRPRVTQLVELNKK